MRWDLLALVALHALLLAVGGASVYVRGRFAASDWPRVARAVDGADVSAADVAALALGVASLVAVAVGAAGALRRSKPLLLLQGALLLLVLAAATFLAVRVLQTNNRAHGWRSIEEWEASSASAAERRLASSFDAEFCGAQLAFVCDRATVAQIAALGVDNVALIAGNATSDTRSQSVSAACRSQQNASSWQEICEVCEQEQPQYADFSSISEWVQDYCAYSASSMEWCGVATAGSASGSLLSENASDGETSPYEQCRSELLSQVDDWTEALGVAWSCTGVLVLLLLAFVVLLLRYHANANALDLEEAMSLQTSSITSTDREEHARNDKV